MSTSYTANFGVGYEVKEIDEDILEEYDGNLYEYLYSVPTALGIEVFEIGSYYSGEMEGVFLVVNHDFKNSNDLTESKAKLEEEIKNLQELNEERPKSSDDGEGVGFGTLTGKRDPRD